jgi:hypothetical protein
MWGSNVCAAAGGAGGSKQAAWAGSTACTSAPHLDVQGDTGRAGWAAGRVGLHPDHLPERVGGRRSPPTVGPAGRAVDPSPRRVGRGWRPELLPVAALASRQRHGRARSRTVPPLIVPLARHSWLSSAASGPVPCSRYCRSPWLQNGRPWMRHARQRQSQVCGVHGRASSGLSQQVHLRPLSIPDPGGMLISPGRRVFWRPTKRHRPCPVARLRPTQQTGANAKPEPHGAPTLLPGGGACRTGSGAGWRPEGATAGPHVSPHPREVVAW